MDVVTKTTKLSFRISDLPTDVSKIDASENIKSNKANHFTADFCSVHFSGITRDIICEGKFL
jgi:hypothetical protein